MRLPCDAVHPDEWVPVMACGICHGEDHARGHCPWRPEAVSFRVGQLKQQLDEGTASHERFRASVAWWDRHRQLRLALDGVAALAGLATGIVLAGLVAHTAHPPSLAVESTCPDCPVCSSAPVTRPAPPKVPPRPWKPRAVDAGTIEPLPLADAGPSNSGR